MNPDHRRTPIRPRSPLVRPARAALDAAGPGPEPRPHTDAELTALLTLLTTTGPRLNTVAVGHSRDDASRAAAAAFVAAWRDRGKEVAAVVDWPEQAASWLRQARRLTASAPDAWVIAAAPLGWAQMSGRLLHSTDWDPSRTFAFASLHGPLLPALAEPAALDGLRGVTADGGTWEMPG